MHPLQSPNQACREPGPIAFARLAVQYYVRVFFRAHQQGPDQGSNGCSRQSGLRKTLPLPIDVIPQSLSRQSDRSRQAVGQSRPALEAQDLVRFPRKPKFPHFKVNPMKSRFYNQALTADRIPSHRRILIRAAIPPRGALGPEMRLGTFTTISGVTL